MLKTRRPCFKQAEYKKGGGGVMFFC